MSRIEKLSITGVRSFDNQTTDYIKFFTPLTLIVGTNGSGKTTIIECLKFATTGELPPNSKGGAFIHEPKLCGEKEVLANVGLQYISIEQTRFSATRKLQLTVKKATRSMKTLEGNHTVHSKDSTERVSVSTKVADINSEVPRNLGVPIAILDAVIFCHQDESLWPMSEPAALKKRFDEIFEAQKFTKAVDNIKALRKKKNEELAVFKNTEEHAKKDKTKADEIKKDGIKLHDEINDLREEHTLARDKAQEAGKTAKNAWQHVAKYDATVNALNSARNDRERCATDLADLAADLEERNESDNDLKSKLEHHEQDMASVTKRIEEQHKRYKVVQGEVDAAREKSQAKSTEVGGLQQQKATHEQRVKDREAGVKSAAKEYSIRGFDMDLDDDQIAEFIERMTRLRNDQNNKVDRARKDTTAEVQVAQDALAKLRDQRSTLQQSRKYAKDQLDTNERKISALHTEFSGVEGNESAKVSVESAIEELSLKLKKSKQQITDEDYATRIKELNDQIQKLEDESSTLKADLVRGTKQAGQLAKLDHARSEQRLRERNMQTLKGTHEDRLRQLLNHSWDPNTIETDFQQVLDSKKVKATEAEKNRDAVNTQLNQVEYRLSTARNDIKKREKELADCDKKIEQKTGDEPSSYPENLALSQANYDTRKTDLDGFKHMVKWYNDAIKTALSQNPACRLCRRSFDDQKEGKEFADRLQSLITKQALTGLEKEFDAMKKELDDTKSVSTDYDTWERLSEKEIPSLRELISKLENERDVLVRQCEEHDDIISTQEEAKRDVEILSKSVSTIAQCASELKDFKASIEELSAQQSDSGLGQTLEEIQEKIEEVESKAKEQKRVLGKIQAESDRQKDLVNSLGLELSNAKNKLIVVQHELEKRDRITSQIEEMKQVNKQQREAIQNLDKQLQELGPQLFQQEAKLQDVQHRGEAKVTDLQSQASNIMDDVRKLQHIDQEARSYVEQGGPVKLERCQRDIQSLQENISSYGEELRTVTIGINKLQKEQSNQDREKRVIKDNLKYRQRKKELTDLENTIDQLSRDNAEADQARYRHDAERWQNEFEKFNMEAASKSAEMKVKDDELKKFEISWEKYYKNSAGHYKRAHIDVETTKAAVGDLGKYAGALEKAILKFHTLKMDEINRTIDELWRSTYQGTDIDTILIRSDSETGKSNRSYNYRVCMIKQDVEMDMRGRCSAGQKVLASIVIRLALADSFGVRCGLITLDEPTTNLDRDNIRALAQSLHRLIKERQKQRNFQLVVITHDEDFLREMKCGEFADYYWRVYRDEHQKSRIAKQRIDLVM